MAEYIEKQEYCENICRCDQEFCDRNTCLIWKTPAADVAPVRHGYLEKIEDDYFCIVTLKCSLCHEEWTFEDYSDDPDYNWNYNFCPNCGAKMDGGENNDKP